ncbi:MAG: tetratricopeptide repeat protein [Xenococcaceae cyanobacterium]
MKTDEFLELNVKSAIDTAVQKHQLGKLDEAESIYRQILQIQSNCEVGAVSSENQYNVMTIVNLGNVLQQQGKLDEAVDFYQQALRLKPDPGVYNNLGNVLRRQGKLDEAINSYQQALHLKPDLAEAYQNLGNVLQRQDNLDEAINSYQQALRLKPKPGVYNNLGNAFQRQGRLDEAIESYQQALHLKPDLAEAYQNLGNAFQRQGNLDEAIESYQQALHLKPSPGVYNNLGNAFQRQGRLDEAINSYQQALHLKPDWTQPHYNLGNAFKGQGKLDEAINSYQQALRLDPNYTQAHYNLGNAFQEQGKLDEAIDCYKQVIRLKPDVAVYNNLGNALQEQGQSKAAIECYQQALRLEPERAQAHYNLGNALKQQGQLEAAIECYQQALRLEPDLVYAKFNICMSQLPIIYSSVDEIELRRDRYRQNLQKLAQSLQMADRQEREKAAEAVGSSQPFYLAYQGLNDRDLQQTYGEMICQLMSSRYPQWSQPIPIPNLEAKEKIRVGFVSGFFRYHSNWKIPIKGWVENLDRNKFELFAYHTDSTQDECTAKATQAFVKFIQGPLSVEQWCEAIAQDKLHILIFPELGMDPMTVKLACLRLAPIQMTSWGHPNTSGLPTIDYYLSSELMEPENAGEHYTEKLVRLPNLSIHYSPVEVQPKAISKTEIDIQNDEIMFWCCQSLFKYLPQHDDVFPRIAKELPKCKFIFINHHQSELVTGVFRQRLSRAFEELELNDLDYCIFLPRLDRSTFAGTAAIADVFLDSIAWSGCNSSLEAINYDIPIVTWPGELMRGRHSLAMLKMMGIEEMIASSKDEYVKIAVRLGRDLQYRQHISRQVAENKHKLYEDLEPIKSLENLFLNVVHSSVAKR